MQKKIIVAILVSALFISLIPPSGYCQTSDKKFELLKLELNDEGVSDEFIYIVRNATKKMIASAAATVDIKIVLLDLWGQKVEGRALKNAVAAVAELVESGDNVLEAASIASTAAHKAESEGLSGFGVGMRVRKAVQDRKVYLRSLKNNI